MGQEVFVLDPFKITGIPSSSYNVFDEMARVAERDIDAPVKGKIAESLVEITGRDPYWDTAARRILMGLILYVFQEPADKRNLVQVRRLLMEGDKDAFEAGVHAGYIDPKENDAFDALLISMQHCPPGPYRDTIAFAAGSLSKMSPNQLRLGPDHGDGTYVVPRHAGDQAYQHVIGLPARRSEDRAISVYLCLPSMPSAASRGGGCACSCCFRST